MRSHAILLAALLAFSSGCLSGEGNDPAPSDAPASPATNATVPAPLHFEGDVAVGVDPFNLVDGTPCSTDASTCFKHDFTVEEGTNVSVSLEATLAWTIEANDFDLYLYEGEEQLSQDGINQFPPAGASAPPTMQVLRHDGLGPGDYSFWVVAWNAAADSYTLDVTFS